MQRYAEICRDMKRYAGICRDMYFVHTSIMHMTHYLVQVLRVGVALPVGRHPDPNLVLNHGNRPHPP